MYEFIYVYTYIHIYIHISRTQGMLERAAAMGTAAGLHQVCGSVYVCVCVC